MSNISELKWIDIDSQNQETFIDNIRFVKPKKSSILPLACPSCKSLICTIEDIEMLKKENVCSDCHLRFYYTNKEKWEKGWRPINIKR